MEHKNKSTWTRRRFLASSGAAGMLLPFASPSPARASSEGDVSLAGLKDAFLNPPFSTRPMTRWWWFGGAATPQEITRELTIMRDAGLRGVELQPVYPVAVDDAKLGIRNTRYFSPEWFDLLRHTLEETRRLGLQFDFTLGSGWPYGGPFVPPRVAGHEINVVTQDAKGPQDFSWRLYPYLTGGGRVFAVVAAPVEDSGKLDVTRSVIVGGGARRGSIRWTVPTGQWRVMAFIDSLTGQQVKRPTIGMEGYVIDHFDERALDLFLDAAGNRTIEELRVISDPPFYSVFCDSLEVFGADWTPRFIEEFEKRRGYNLTPYLPALWQDAGEVTPSIRYDYHLTLSDLISENFFARLGAWSHRHKMKARIQAHGAMGDVMRGYSMADIPEGEEGVFADRYSVIIDHRRLASSAGHIYQKPVISCESYTWLRQPLFFVTLEEMKGATDSSFLDGINQIVNQGYSYSPPQAGEPGWVFYASTMANHNNIWWRHYKHLARYIQRAAAVLLKGASVNPVAVYVPLADIYSHFGLGSLTMDTEIQQQLGPELFMDLRRAGYDFDLINDDALTRISRVEDVKLKAGTAEYSVVVVPGVEYMPAESLSRLAEFARQGGLLIFTERLPEWAPGLQERQSGTERLRKILAGIWGNSSPATNSVHTTGNGKAVLTAERAGALKHIESFLAPDFKIVQAGSAELQQRAVENVGFLHRQSDALDFYFLSNVSRYEFDLRAQFQAGHKAPQRWNPEDGSVEETLAFQYVASSTGPATEVQLHLDPFESCFIVFSSKGGPVITVTNLRGRLSIERAGNKAQITGLAPENGEYAATDAHRKTHRIAVKDVPGPIPIGGPWRVTLGESPTMSITELQSWTEFPEGKNYSGWGTYEIVFDMPILPGNIGWMIDLGAVHETAEASLNGINLGAAWCGLRRLACRNALKKGRNHLKVEVGNLWIQKVESLPKPDLKPVARTFGIRWGRYGETTPPQAPPSGLLGPVRLLPFKRVGITV